MIVLVETEGVDDGSTQPGLVVSVHVPVGLSVLSLARILDGAGTTIGLALSGTGSG